MIEKLNSLEMMEKFNTALSDIENLNNDLENVKNRIETKLSYLNTAQIYTSQLIQNLELNEASTSSDTIIFNHEPDKIVNGQYNSYGLTYHSAFVKMPANVFNFLTETGPLYKDNAIVEFYTDESEKDYRYQYSDILKHESDPSKDDVFKIFEQNTFTMAVQVNAGNLTGGTTCNMIEICPYLPGSFNIEQIRIYTIDQYYTQDLTVPARTIDTLYEDVGCERIYLDTKYQIYRIEFDIRVNFQFNGYPFGLRHLYFLEADMDSESDYLVVEVDKENYINSVGQDITIIRPGENLDTTAENYGVEYYLFYDNGTLQTPLTNPIARNITSFYAKIPLREPLIGIRFNNIILS